MFQSSFPFLTLVPSNLPPSRRFLSQLWRPLQAAEDGARSRGVALRPAAGLRVRLGPGRRRRGTHLHLAHRGSSQAAGKSGGKGGGRSRSCGVHAVLLILHQEKESSSRKVRVLEPEEAKPELALEYLEYLLKHTATREEVLALGEGPLKQLHAVLEKWKVRRAPPLLSSRCVCAPHLKHAVSAGAAPRPPQPRPRRARASQRGDGARRVRLPRPPRRPPAAQREFSRTRGLFSERMTPGTRSAERAKDTVTSVFFTVGSLQL